MASLSPPLEIWVMIVDYMGEFDHLRSAWLWCRPICRLAKHATEMAVCTNVLPQLDLQIFTRMDCAVLNEYWKPLVRTTYHEVRFQLPFDRLSTDGCRAIFHTSREPEMMIASIVARWEDGKGDIWPILNPSTEEAASIDQRQDTRMNDILSYQWNKHLASLEEAKQHPPGNAYFQPYVVGTSAAMVPPKSDIDLDLENFDISVSWRPLVNLVMKEGEEIGKELKESVLGDVERSLSMIRTPTTKEKALKIALSSEVCRWPRFWEAIDVAAVKRAEKRHQQYGEHSLKYHMDLELIRYCAGRTNLLMYCGDKNRRVSPNYHATIRWYQEWKSYLLADIAKA